MGLGLRAGLGGPGIIHNPIIVVSVVFSIAPI